MDGARITLRLPGSLAERLAAAAKGAGKPLAVHLRERLAGGGGEGADPRLGNAVGACLQSIKKLADQVANLSADNSKILAILIELSTQQNEASGAVDAKAAAILAADSLAKVSALTMAFRNSNHLSEQQEAIGEAQAKARLKALQGGSQNA